MKNLLILLILIGFSATAFAQYMRNISNQTLEYNLPIIRLTQENTIPPPLKQIKAGIAPKDVVCKQGLELVMKKSNGQPICVKGTSVKTLTLRNYISEYNGAFGGEIPSDPFNRNQTNSIPLTLFPVTPQNVTLPDTTKQTQTFTDRISINKINQLKITNSDSTNGQKTHLAQLSINGVTLHTEDSENLPVKPGFDTLVFDYTIQNKDNDAFYAILDFEIQIGSKKYPTLPNDGGFSEILLSDEKRDSSFAIQIGKDANQVILNVKDPITQKTLWSIPVDLKPFNIKYKPEEGILVQENEN